MSDRIPPRPWRVSETGTIGGGRPVADILHLDPAPDSLAVTTVARMVPLAAAEHIVRLVNAEPEIVAALEAARDRIVELMDVGPNFPIGYDDALDDVRNALAQLKP